MAADPSDAGAGGVLVQFPVQRTCFVCPHHEDHELPDGSLFSFCTAFNQPIDSEAYEAEDCSLFSIDPEKVE